MLPAIDSCNCAATPCWPSFRYSKAGWHFPLTLAEPSLIAPYLLSTLASAFVTNWVYYNARESALLAILYHTAANTIGTFYSHMITGADLTRYFWLLAAVNCVAVVVVVIVDRNTWRSHNPVVPANVEAVAGIS